MRNRHIRTYITRVRENVPQRHPATADLMGGLSVIEKDIEKKLRDGIRNMIPKAKCLKFVSPGFSGVPDRIILLPGGLVVFAETKRPKDSERQRQLFVQACLRRLGFTVFSTVDTLDKVQVVIDHCYHLYCVCGKGYMASKGEKV